MSSFADKIDRLLLKKGISHFPYIAWAMVNIACNVPFYPSDATIPLPRHKWKTISASNCFRWRRVHLCTDNDPSGHLGVVGRKKEPNVRFFAPNCAALSAESPTLAERYPTCTLNMFLCFVSNKRDDLSCHGEAGWVGWCTLSPVSIGGCTLCVCVLTTHSAPEFSSYVLNGAILLDPTKTEIWGCVFVWSSPTMS